MEHFAVFRTPLFSFCFPFFEQKRFLSKSPKNKLKMNTSGRSFFRRLAKSRGNALFSDARTQKYIVLICRFFAG